MNTDVDIVLSEKEFFTSFGKSNLEAEMIPNQDKSLVHIENRNEQAEYICKIDNYRNVFDILLDTDCKNDTDVQPDDDFIEKEVDVVDFNNKNNILNSIYSEASSEDMYIKLFGKLDRNCNLLLNKKERVTTKHHKLMDIISNNDTVFIYTQFFKNRRYDITTGEVIWNEKTLLNLIGLKCFVVDLDEVTSDDIHNVIGRIENITIKPNYIVSTGNGLHLYFIFNKKHNVKASLGLMAYIEKRKKTACLDVYNNIKKKMISWFTGLSVVADSKNHLVQPSRLFGSKTKDPAQYTKIFRVADTMYSIQQIAELVGEELPDDSDIKEWKKYCKHYKEEKKKEKINDVETVCAFISNNNEQSEILESVKNSTYGVIGQKKYNYDWTKVKEQINKDNEEYKLSIEYQRTQNYVKYKKDTRWQNIQRKGYASQYNQFNNMIITNAKVGNRLKSLHIFWNRAPAYQDNKDIILKDFYSMVAYFNSISVNKVTDQQVLSILNGIHYDYNNESILTNIGLEVTFVNRKKQERQEAKTKREEKIKLILEISEVFITEQPDISYRKLKEILNDHGVNVSHKTISTMSEIVSMKEKYFTTV